MSRFETLLVSTGLSEEQATKRGLDMLDGIREEGYARVELTPVEQDAFEHHMEVSKGFFAAGPAHNGRYSTSQLVNGYRPPESASVEGLPDSNDSFLYWNEEYAKQIPYYKEIWWFLESNEGYRMGTAAIMLCLMMGLDKRYSYGNVLPFEKASLLQTNSNPLPIERELVQASHEDGTLATVHGANDPGLEAVDTDGTIRPIAPVPGQVIIFPGSILTAMTGGEIPPLYHQVRNTGNLLGRRAVMYFSCPNVDNAIRPFVVNDTNRDTDIKELVLASTDMFGLPANIVAEH